MGKRLKDPRERVTQKSIGFAFRQIEFFNKYPDFRPDQYCREVVDKQIKLIDSTYLKNEERTDE